MALRGLTASNAHNGAMIFEDFGADPKTEASSGGALGGEEGLEDVTPRFWSYPNAGVGDSDTNAFLAGETAAGAKANHDLSAARTGVERVADEICEDLAKIASKGDDLGIDVISPFDGDAHAADPALEEGEDVIKQFPQRGFVRIGGLAMKAQGLSGDNTDAGELLLSGGKVLLFSSKVDACSPRYRRLVTASRGLLIS